MIRTTSFWPKSHPKVTLFKHFSHRPRMEKKAGPTTHDQVSKQTEIWVLSNGYLSSPKSLIIAFDQKRILVNCGEGVQRLIINLCLKLNKIDTILLTRFDWLRAASLRPLSMGLVDSINWTFKDQSRSKPQPLLNHLVKIHCPVDLMLNSSLSSFKRYGWERKLKAEQFHYGSGASSSNDEYKDTDLSVKRIPMSTNKHIWSYLLRIEKPLPNIDSDKLKQLDVKPGEWIKEIILGNDVTLPNGRIIRSSDLLDHSNSYDRKILVLDCESISDLDAVSDTLGEPYLSTIVHMGPSDLINRPEYLDLMKQRVRNPDCIHFYMDEAHPNVDILRVYKLQAKLNLMNSSFFKLLPVQTKHWEKIFEEAKSKEKRLREKLKVVQAHSGMIFRLKPRILLDLNLDQQKIDNYEFRNEIVDFYDKDPLVKIDGIDESEKAILDKIRERIPEKQKEEISSLAVTDHENFPNILFLGTGSASPSINRNITSILFNLNDSQSIMFDCSESTIGQINRYHADETDFNQTLCKIKALCISHAHLDHFLGSFGLVRRRREAFKKLGLEYEKLAIIHPCTLSHEFKGVCGMFSQSIGDFFKYVDLITIDSTSENNLESIKNQLGIKSLASIRVDHIPYSYAFVLELDNFKLVYSGDCRPCEALVKAGQECDILIHECTFDDAHQSEARLKKHSTISEALVVSQRMRARATILTHFSLRYRYLTRVDDILENKMNLSGPVGLAFDFMKCGPHNFHQISDMLADMKVVFKENVEFNETRRQKKLKTSLK